MNHQKTEKYNHHWWNGAVGINFQPLRFQWGFGWIKESKLINVMIWPFNLNWYYAKRKTGNNF